MPDSMNEEAAGQPVFEQPDGHHLAQLNLASAVADLDDPVMAGFMDALAGVNAIAEKSDGFIWRLTDPAVDAAAKALLDDPRETYTLSVWEDAAALEFFVWNTVHRRFMKNRHSWFRPATAPILVMWWLPAGEGAGFRRRAGAAGPAPPRWPVGRRVRLGQSCAASAPGRRPARRRWAE